MVELLRVAKLPCRLIPVQITGGMDEGSDGVYHRVPKRDLVTGLQILFDHWNPRLYTAAPGVKDLVRELVDFKARPSSSGNMRFEGARDDLAMALAWPGGGCGNASRGSRRRRWQKGYHGKSPSCG